MFFTRLPVDWSQAGNRKDRYWKCSDYWSVKKKRVILHSSDNEVNFATQTSDCNYWLSGRRFNFSFSNSKCISAVQRVGEVSVEWISLQQKWEKKIAKHLFSCNKKERRGGGGELESGKQLTKPSTANNNKNTRGWKGSVIILLRHWIHEGQNKSHLQI